MLIRWSCRVVYLLAFVSLMCQPSSAMAAEARGWVQYVGEKGPGEGKHLVFLAGDEEYRSEEGLPMLAKLLAQRHGFKCTVLFSVGADGNIDPNNSFSLSGAEQLDTADEIIMLLRFRQWPDDVLKHFDDAYRRGTPIVALRTSTHAFNLAKNRNNAAYFNGFGKNVLGEQWVSHWGKHKVEATRGILEPSHKDDPLLRGIGEGEIFGDTDVYEVYPPSDAKILVRGQVLKGMGTNDSPADYRKARASDKQEQGVNSPMMPVAWTRLYKNENGKTNRIFCTTMGAATDLQNTALRRLIVNAVYWGLNFDVPLHTSVTLTGDYKPTPYGFNGFKKGIKPSDLAVQNQPALKTSQAEGGLPPMPEAIDPAPTGVRSALAASRLPLEFFKRERVALVGNCLAERFNLFGHFEALIHAHYRDKELVIRNFARPADEVAVRQRPNDYTKIDDPLSVFSPDTFLCFFGFNESFAGENGVGQFKEDYEKYLDEMASHYARGEGNKPPRFVLVTPIAFEKDGPETKSLLRFYLPDGKKENASLQQYADAIKEIGKKRNLAVIDLFTPTLQLFEREPGLQFTINGCHQNEEGDREIARLLASAVTGLSIDDRNLQPLSNDKFEALKTAVKDKAWVHLQDYRMLNGWYVYGGRRTWDMETFPREYRKIRNMAAMRDRAIWAFLKDPAQALHTDDSGTGDLFVPKTRFGMGNRSEAESPRILSPEADLKTFKVPEGFQVSLFASEREFPELAKPCQLSFDNRGRLWAACMPTYPQWLPGDGKPNDRLLIFEDTNQDGKADVCKTFYDKLHCPTGFEFWEGGVLVVDQPRILWLKDTDGDDKADVVVHLLDGWATDDTHHTVGAFESSHGGILHMLEGVAVSTTVETPWGPVRNLGTPGAYQFDPRTLRITHFVTLGYGNPWCYVFNPWGQGFCGDGTTGTQHWDSPLSGAQFRGRRGMEALFDTEGMRPVVGTEFLFTRQFPDDVQGHFVYGCVINMNGFTRFQLHDDGAGFRGARLKKEVDGKLVPDDLLTSTDKHFRPVDGQIGPDGAFWFGDWANPLIGHMQYSQRDPLRDHKAGRLYRLVYAPKPLLTPVTQQGKSISELLAQLSEPEARTRSRARNELHSRPKGEVLGAVNYWLTQVAEDRLLMEALWIQQSFHAVDEKLLNRVLAANSSDARAAAVHLMADEMEFGGANSEQYLARIATAVKDEHPRVRLEAVRALSFIPTLASIEAAYQVTSKPMDYWISYTLSQMIGALQPVWEKSLADGALAKEYPGLGKYLSDYGTASAPGAVAQRVIDKLLSQRSNTQDKEAAMNDLGKMSGNAANGRAVFGRTCRNCHVVGNDGFEYGPALTDLALRLKPRDMIESIVDPNAKLDAKYQTTVILTTEGKTHTGLVTKEDAKSVTLKFAATIGQALQTVEIPKDKIDDRQVLKQSSMPEGLANSLSPLDLLDLLEYLKSLKTRLPTTPARLP